MDNQNTSLALRSSKKIFFDHKDMDYYLSWILGREIYDGSNRQECLSTAGRITNADADSWNREWCILAEQVQRQAEGSLQTGDTCRSEPRRPHAASNMHGDLGPYRILRVLGRGGQGSVYLGEHRGSGEHAAIKTVRLADEAALASIRREIEALARLYWQALQVAEPAILDDAEMPRIVERFRHYGPR